MRIQLDTDEKTIVIEEEVNLSAFYKHIKKMLPDNQWKEYTLRIAHIENWSNPFTIITREHYYEPTKPDYPSFPWITCSTNGDDTQIVLNTDSNTVTGIKNTYCVNIEEGDKK